MTAALPPQHRRLVRLADLTNRHHGRMVDVNGLHGELTGILPLGNRVQLALIVGGARAWTDWLDANAAVEVWRV